MIGIYKITNKENGKSYIGQSVNIERRLQEHIRRDKQYIDMAIQKYGSQNFTFETIEECDIDNLDEREEYWTLYYNSIAPNGYNIGVVKSNSIGENNSMSKLTNADIITIRQCYRDKVFDSAAELARQLYPDMSPEYISQIFYGKAWQHINIDVYTLELENYYKDKVNHSGARKPGEYNPASILKEEDVIKMRALYTVKKRNEIFPLFPNYQNRTIISILTGQNWKHLPIYKKQEKLWIFPEEWNASSKVDFLNKVKEIINANL